MIHVEYAWLSGQCLRAYREWKVVRGERDALCLWLCGGGVDDFSRGRAVGCLTSLPPLHSLVARTVLILEGRSGCEIEDGGGGVTRPTHSSRLGTRVSGQIAVVLVQVISVLAHRF